MTKYLLNLLFIVGIALAIYAVRQATVVQFANKQIERAEHRQDKQRELTEQRFERDKATQEQKRLDEPVKTLVRAKDVRACMTDLDTDILNNEVIECTKDHYITVKRRDVEL